MHERNRYRGPHDFDRLARFEPALADYLGETPDGRTSLNFADPEAVRLLNRTLLRKDYGLKFWDVPKGHLVPPIPSRLDYIHHLGDLIGDTPRPRGLDIGTGPGCIYPILGCREYGWSFVATDIDAKSLRVAQAILNGDKKLNRSVELQLQPDPAAIFRGIIRPEDRFAFTVCNPPFYDSAETAAAATRKKWKKLGIAGDRPRNFGGSTTELWTPGGEPAFLRRMIAESVNFTDRVSWFTSLVSQKGYLAAALYQIKKLAFEHRIIQMEQGKKVRRILCWRKIN